MKQFDTTEKTVYEAIKEVFTYLGVDKALDETTFKRLAGRYKDYIIDEASAWTQK